VFSLDTSWRRSAFAAVRGSSPLGAWLRQRLLVTAAADRGKLVDQRRGRIVEKDATGDARASSRVCSFTVC
jgi:hypothetical protein